MIQCLPNLWQDFFLEICSDDYVKARKKDIKKNKGAGAVTASASLHCPLSEVFSFVALDEGKIKEASAGSLSPGSPSLLPLY